MCILYRPSSFNTFQTSFQHLGAMSTLIVTVSEKTRHMGFFVKVEFYVWLISSTIELTRVQVSKSVADPGGHMRSLARAADAKCKTSSRTMSLYLFFAKASKWSDLPDPSGRRLAPLRSRGSQ